MTKRMAVPEDMIEGVAKFLSDEGIPLEAVPAGSQAALAVRRGERQQSDLHALAAGGWVACPAALVLAPRLGITTRQLGRLLDFLHVKVKACSLGCFK